MPENDRISPAKGNTPLGRIPPDYCPPGSGAWFVIPAGRDAGKKLFFRDQVVGGGDPRDTIVLVHGNPESSYTYRNVIREIEASAARPCRIVAMDHIGYGLSDRATYEMVDMDHAANLFQLIEHLDLSGVTLVVHDWGGPIGIGAFLRAPARVRNLVITNTTVFPIPAEGYTFRNYPFRFLPWSRLPYLIPGALWGHLASFIVTLEPSGPVRLLAGFCRHLAGSLLGWTPLSDAQRVYREQLSVRANVSTSKRFVLQTPHWGRGVAWNDPRLGRRDTTPFYDFIHQTLAPAWGPQGQRIGVRAVLGRWDPLGKDAVIRQWTAHLPQLEGHVRVFEGVGHFIEEFKPREIAEAVLEVTGLTGS